MIDDDDDYDATHPDYARFDISLDVLASLELAARESARADDDSAWKWLIVATQMAAASAMVGYLTDTTGFGALTDRDHAQLAKWLESRNKVDAPPDRIAEFPVLLDRLVAGQCGAPASAAVEIVDLVEGLRKLNVVRGRFNHFREEGWSIEKAYALPLIRSGLMLVARIKDHGWAFRHASVSTVQRMDSAISIVRTLT